jgi:CRP-like cAMP-binding protein
VEFRNSLLSALTKSDREAVLPAMTEWPLERGRVLFEPGQRVEQVFFPSSAVISVVTIMGNGQGVESSTVGHESAVPLLSALSGQPIRARIFAQIGGGGIMVPAGVLRERAVQSPSMMSLLLSHVGAISFQAEQGLACNALHDAPTRLARWILMTQDRTGSGVLPLTQDYMAIMTGVQRTTISAVANQLRSEGLIRYSRGNLEVTDRAGLEARACECYNAIRDEFDSLAKR